MVPFAMLWGACFVLLLMVLVTTPTTANPTQNVNRYVPLYNYIDHDDGAFAWRDLHKSQSDLITRATIHFLELTSQRWLPDYVAPDHVVWKHMLLVIEPIESKLDNAEHMTLWVTGGSRPDDPLDFSPGIDDLAVGLGLASKSNAYAAMLFQVPNQPITFFDKELISEDRLMGYSWSNWMANYKTLPPHTVVNFAMTKAVIKAMDALKQWSALRNPQHPIKTFYLTGASKRGLTVALATAYEGYKQKQQQQQQEQKNQNNNQKKNNNNNNYHHNVIGTTPMVYDAYKFTTTIPRVLTAYGNWSFAMEPYISAGVMDYVHRPELLFLESLIDLLSRDYFADYQVIPRLLLGATGDEFFTLDNTRYFWDEMLKNADDGNDNINNNNQKQIKNKNKNNNKNNLHSNLLHKAVIPNSNHALFTNLNDVLYAVGGHINTLIYLTPQHLPKIYWEVDEGVGGEIVLTIHDVLSDDNSFHVTQISVWYAMSPENLDKISTTPKNTTTATTTTTRRIMENDQLLNDQQQQQQQEDNDDDDDKLRDDAENIPNRRDFRMMRRNYPGTCHTPNMEVKDGALCLMNIPWKQVELLHNTTTTTYSESTQQWVVRYKEQDLPEQRPTKADGKEVFAAFFLAVDLELRREVTLYDGRVVTKHFKQRFTTNPSIVPNIFPFPACQVGNCRKDLV